MPIPHRTNDIYRMLLFSGAENKVAESGSRSRLQIQITNVRDKNFKKLLEKNPKILFVSCSTSVKYIKAPGEELDHIYSRSAELVKARTRHEG